MTTLQKNLEAIVKHSKFDMKGLALTSGNGATFVRDIIKTRTPNPGINGIQAIAKVVGYSLDALLNDEQIYKSLEKGAIIPSEQEQEDKPITLSAPSNIADKDLMVAAFKKSQKEIKARKLTLTDEEEAVFGAQILVEMQEFGTTKLAEQLVSYIIKQLPLLVKNNGAGKSR